jgi:hypothetical protein
VRTLANRAFTDTLALPPGDGQDGDGHNGDRHNGHRHNGERGSGSNDGQPDDDGRSRDATLRGRERAGAEVRHSGCGFTDPLKSRSATRQLPAPRGRLLYEYVILMPLLGYMIKAPPDDP